MNINGKKPGKYRRKELPQLQAKLVELNEKNWLVLKMAEVGTGTDIKVYEARYKVDTLEDARAIALATLEANKEHFSGVFFKF